MDLGIAGKRAIVTGGSRGIGRCSARQFLQEGARVLICARDGAAANLARDELAAETGGEVHAVQADTSKEADLARLVDTAKAKLGGVDILVNNAGTMYSGRFAALDDDKHLEKTRKTNFQGLELFAKELPKIAGGLEMVPSYANFLLVKTGNGRQVFGELQKRKVIVRPMDGYGLPEWIRITVGTPAQNRAVLKALHEIL